MIERSQAIEMDRADPLAHCREWFVIPDDTIVYLDGNSLGRLPTRTLDRLDRVINDEWAAGLIRSWDHWLDMPRQVGDVLAPLIGAHEGEVVVHDSTSVNLYQAMHAAIGLRPGRRVIAIDPGEFPTDYYLATAIAQALGYEIRHDFDRLDDVAVVVRSLVDYRSAVRLDLVAETARVHAAGAVMLWDLCHAIGAVEIDLHAAGVQLAVGCTYKYLNGGPGAPAFTFVDRSLHTTIDQPLHGWYAQRDQFEMDPTFVPHDDIRRMLIGTPPILALAAANEGIAMVVEVGMPAIAAKGRELTALGLQMCDELGLATSTPADAARRGAHIAVHHERAEEIATEMTRRGVITDLRRPDIIRVGCSPLTTRFVDVWDGMTMIAALAGR